MVHMRKVIVLSGCSGSGKSEYVKKFGKIAGPSHAVPIDVTPEHVSLSEGDYVGIVSADTFFINAEGEYKFEGAKLPEAHALCFRSFIRALQTKSFYHQYLFVDNTNTTTVEIAPYMLAASAFGWPAEVLTFMFQTPVPDIRPTFDKKTKKLERLDNVGTRPFWREPKEAELHFLEGRNNHRVPASEIKSQYERIWTRELPPWWKNTFIEIKK